MIDSLANYGALHMLDHHNLKTQVYFTFVPLGSWRKKTAYVKNLSPVAEVALLPAEVKEHRGVVEHIPAEVEEHIPAQVEEHGMKK